MSSEDSEAQFDDLLHFEELQKSGRIRRIGSEMTARWGAARLVENEISVQWSEWNATFPHAVLQSLVEPVAGSPDGVCIRLVKPAWDALRAILSRDPRALHYLDPRQLEELVAASYDQAGYDEVVLTPRSGDFGRDVIASKSGWGSIRIIDQVKAFSRERLVGANDVRALLGVLQSDRSATNGIVTTTSDFAPRIADDPFISPFIPYRLELVNGSELRARIIAVNR